MQCWRLLRWDVMLVAFASYLVGVRMAGGVQWADVYVAAGTALLPTNFIYVLNAWADRDIDGINKPRRPIPAGRVRPGAALGFAVFLAAASLLFVAAAVTAGHASRVLFVLPLLGALYSLEPVRLKRYAPAAVLATALGLTTPILAGYLARSASPAPAPFFLVLFLYAGSVVMLKDSGDERGDRRHGMGNVSGRLGRWTAPLAGAGMAAAVLLSLLWVRPVALCAALAVLAATSLALVAVSRGVSPRLYRCVVWTAVAETCAMTPLLLARGW